MTIKVMGGGCKNCKKLLENTKQVVANSGIDAQVLYVTDMAEIAKTGAMRMPLLVVDDKIVSEGKVLSSNEISKILIPSI